MRQAVNESPALLLHSGRHGYALIVVLAALMILTFLASLSSKTLLVEYQSNRATLEFQNRQALSTDAVTYVMDLALGVRTPMRLQLPGHDDVWVELVDIGGLIDLKTARSALSAKVMTYLELTADQERRFRNWQRDPGPEADVSAFLRAIGGAPDQLLRLSSVATLRSGRPGISPQHAPREVLELITDGKGSREALIGRVPVALISQPRPTLTQVWVNRDGARWLAGEVRIADDHSAAWLWAP